MKSQFESLSEQKMDTAIEAYKGSLSNLRTGRAQPSLLDRVMVDYYGSQTPLKQLANVVVEDSRTLSVQAYDHNAVQTIEKAIVTSGLDLNPMTNGNVIRIPLPPLTEEKRLEFIKLAKQESETAKISIRNIRREIKQNIENEQKEKQLSEDEAKREEKNIQSITDNYIKKIDELLAEKEKDLMAV